MKRLMIGLTMLGSAACGAPAEPTWQSWVRIRADGHAIETLKRDVTKKDTQQILQFFNKWVYRAAFQTHQACFEFKEREFKNYPEPGSTGVITRRTSNSVTVRDTVTQSDGPVTFELTLDMACVPSDSWWVWWQEVQDQLVRR